MKRNWREIFEEFKINNDHNKWEYHIDNWYSVEALMCQTGELPNGQYDEVDEMMKFLRNKDLHFKLLKERPREFGSMFLTAKRFLRTNYEYLSKEVS